MQAVSRALTSGSVRSGNVVLNRTAVIQRCQSTQVQTEQKKKEKSMRKPAVHSKSFVQNMFRGMVEPEQAFPYPNVLNEEQKETLEMLVPPTEKFFAEGNDPLKNDALETVPEDTVQVIRYVFAIVATKRGLGVKQELLLEKASTHFLECPFFL